MAELLLIEAPGEFEPWRERVRDLLSAEIAPERLVWTSDSDRVFGDLLAQPYDAPIAPRLKRVEPRVPRQFVDLSKNALLHDDPQRHALLYRLAWKLQTEPRLLGDAADPDVRHLLRLDQAVRRDIHKMRAFVRFREVKLEQGESRFVAWFEPQFRIMQANAAFFVDRFSTMKWSILTPLGSLDWDGVLLRQGPPARREDAPSDDATEQLWRTYYSSIFNPARLKVKAMVKEMPKRYWRNMPEAELIPGLVASAQAREAKMVRAGADAFATEPRPRRLAEISEGISRCRRCLIGCNGTRAVAGEGKPSVPLMIVGEQPGDREETEGQPFVGPAGRLLNAVLAQAGIDREQAYVTNAVKHFKFRQSGKRRLHQNPTASEIDTCRWWLDSERAIVRPRFVLSLGASALRGLTGRTQALNRVRGQAHPLDDGSELWPTVHPSYLLRLDGEARERETERFVSDLTMLKKRITQ